MAWSQALDDVTPGSMLRLCLLVILSELSVLWRREILCGAVNVVEVDFWGLWDFWDLYHLRQSQLILCLPLDLFAQISSPHSNSPHLISYILS